MQITVINANIDLTLMVCRRDLHTIIVDCAPIGFMDAVGVRTLIQVSKCPPLLLTVLKLHSACVCIPFTAGGVGFQSVACPGAPGFYHK